MNSIKINGRTLNYEGLPLYAVVFDGLWSGNSNFLIGDEKEKRILLRSLDHCFMSMKNWSVCEGYRYGYVLDYLNKTIYYDKKHALNHALAVLEKKGQGNYFQNFIQKDFRAE